MFLGKKEDGKNHHQEKMKKEVDSFQRNLYLPSPVIEDSGQHNGGIFRS